MVTAWYVTNDEFPILEKSVNYMARHDWISDIVIVHGDDKKPEYFETLQRRIPGKVHEYWKSFGGRGSDPRAKYELSLVPSVENGGWDELSHRNTALNLAYGFNNQYVLAIDTDEIFAYDSVHLLQAQPEVVYFEFNTWIYMDAIKKYPVSHHSGLRRIHPRIWRTSLGVQYLPHQAPTPGYENQTIHVWPDVRRFRNIALDRPKSFNLQHLHQMFASKRSRAYNNNYPVEKVELVNYKWSDELLGIFKREGTDKYFGEPIDVGVVHD